MSETKPNRVNYKNGFIYKLCCLDPNISEIYVGSSTNFQKRKQQHKYGCNTPSGREYNHYKYQFIRDNGGWLNWNMVEIEKYPCDNKRELERRETEMMIDLKAGLNVKKPFTTDEDKKEHQKTYDKQYAEDNKEKIKQYKTKYREDNKEKGSPTTKEI